MKVTITFDPEEHPNALHADELFKVIHDHNEWLRSQLKYNDHLMSEDEYNALDKAAEHFRGLITEAGLWKLFS